LIRRDGFDEDVDRIKVAYNASWQRNWGFVPMSDREIDHIASQFRPIHVPDLVPFADEILLALGTLLLGFLRKKTPAVPYAAAKR